MEVAGMHPWVAQEGERAASRQVDALHRSRLIPLQAYADAGME